MKRFSAFALLFSLLSAVAVAQVSLSGGVSVGGVVPTIVTKVGSGNGTNYNTSSNAWSDVDGTNLAYTVTVPSGSKVVMMASFTTWVDAGTGSNGWYAITDGTTLLTGCLSANANTGGTMAAIVCSFTGDGASHTFKLRHLNAAGSSLKTYIGNGSSDSHQVPIMVFLVTPSN